MTWKATRRSASRSPARRGSIVVFSDWVLEGGAIDSDGTGLVVTTEQCLLNPNRNPGLSKAEIEALLKADLGFDRVLWLGQGLACDHTDGHVDNLARFVAPNTLAIPLPTGPDDPNAAVYEDARARARDFGVKVVDVPSPGLGGGCRRRRAGELHELRDLQRHRRRADLRHVHDADGVAAIGALFPDRAAVGIPADAVLSGGGSFHCASQHAPALPATGAAGTSR